MLMDKPSNRQQVRLRIILALVGRWQNAMACRRPMHSVRALLLIWADPIAVGVAITAAVVAVIAGRRRARRCCPNRRCANRRSTVRIRSAISHATISSATISSATVSRAMVSCAAVSHATPRYRMPSVSYRMPSVTAVKPSTMETTSERVVGDEGCAHKNGGCTANQYSTQHWLFSFPDNRTMGQRPARRSRSSAVPVRNLVDRSDLPPPSRPAPIRRTACTVTFTGADWCGVQPERASRAMRLRQVAFNSANRLGSPREAGNRNRARKLSYATSANWGCFHCPSFSLPKPHNEHNDLAFRTICSGG